MEKSRADTATRKKVSYDKDLEKSHAGTAIRSKAGYSKDPVSDIKSVPVSKDNFDKDIVKSCAESATQSKANYERDIEASHICNRQRYVILYGCFVHFSNFILCLGTH